VNPDQTLKSGYEVGARRIAEAIIAKATAPSASDKDRTDAETAMIILAKAEKRAGSADHATGEAMIAEINSIGERIEAQIVEMTRHGASDEEIYASVMQSVARSQALEQQLTAKLDHEAANAWKEAFEHLARMIDAGEPGLVR